MCLGRCFLRKGLGSSGTLIFQWFFTSPRLVAILKGPVSYFAVWERMQGNHLQTAMMMEEPHPQAGNAEVSPLSRTTRAASEAEFSTGQLYTCYIHTIHLWFIPHGATITITINSSQNCLGSVYGPTIVMDTVPSFLPILKERIIKKGQQEARESSRFIECHLRYCSCVCP